MDHVAIMNKKMGLIDKILDGRKTIESRWYKNRTAPWGKIKEGETIYFKDSGGLIRARAEVKKVKFFENLTIHIIKQIVDKWGGEGLIDIQNKKVEEWAKDKNYCILIWLTKVRRVEKFEINKSGFGTGAGWITVEDIGSRSVAID
jgi:ASC-1-like (ASCH) protein